MYRWDKYDMVLHKIGEQVGVPAVDVYATLRVD
jgi:hypothetical protein